MACPSGGEPLATPFWRANRRWAVRSEFWPGAGDIAEPVPNYRRSRRFFDSRVSAWRNRPPEKDKGAIACIAPLGYRGFDDYPLRGRRSAIHIGSAIESNSVGLTNGRSRAMLNSPYGPSLNEYYVTRIRN
jgi:hypothetical protein